MQDSIAENWIRARRERAFRLLAIREQSLHELHEKLLKPTSKETADPDKTPPLATCNQLINQLVEWLLKHDLQSDQRFIEDLTNKLLRQGKGPIALRQAYRKHQLDSALVNEQLTALDALWYQQIMRVREKRFGDQAPIDMREAGQMQRFLAQRGFTQGLIRKAVFLD